MKSLHIIIDSVVKCLVLLFLTKVINERQTYNGKNTEVELIQPGLGASQHGC